MKLILIIHSLPSISVGSSSADSAIYWWISWLESVVGWIANVDADEEPRKVNGGCTVPSNLRDLRIPGIWYPRGFWNLLPQILRGMTIFIYWYFSNTSCLTQDIQNTIISKCIHYTNYWWDSSHSLIAIVCLIPRASFSPQQSHLSSFTDTCGYWPLYWVVET